METNRRNLVEIRVNFADHFYLDPMVEIMLKSMGEI